MRSERATFLIGSILDRALLARFCRTLAITLGAGLPVTQCLSIAARAVDNEYVGKRIVAIREDIEAGDTLTAAAHSSQLFTPLVLQMLSVGEETGAVEDTMGEVASYYEREVDYDRERISLSIRQTREDPWESFAGAHGIGDAVPGTVTKTVPFGAFVSVTDGVEGLDQGQGLLDLLAGVPADLLDLLGRRPQVAVVVDVADDRSPDLLESIR